MKYYVWKLTEGDYSERICLLSPNKKKLRGKWQMFVKEYSPTDEEFELIGYRLIIGDITYAIFDDREDQVFKTRLKDFRENVV
jgi:hypothetical protein